MPKITKVGSLGKAAKAVKSKTKDTAPTTLSRGQRKRNAKRQQYLLREKLVLSCLDLKKKEEQRKRIDGLDALRTALKGVSDSKNQTKETKSKPTKVETNHAKKEVTAREVIQMDLVLEHPSFKANPFGTIQEHLRNTLKSQANELEVKSNERAKQDALQEAAKKTKKKERRAENGGKHRKKFHATRRTKR